MTEWRDVLGIENYEVSTDGEIKNKKTGRALKFQDNGHGYLLVDLWVNGKRTRKLVHRLVAEAFIPNPDNKPQVNHMNERVDDNRVFNLNWMTSKENINYGSHNKRLSESLKNSEKLQKLHESQSKQIIIIYRDNTYEEYPSATTAARELGLNQGNIVKVLKGRLKTTGGLRFEYAEDFKG